MILFPYRMGSLGRGICGTLEQSCFRIRFRWEELLNQQGVLERWNLGN